MTSATSPFHVIKREGSPSPANIFSTESLSSRISISQPSSVPSSFASRVMKYSPFAEFGSTFTNGLATDFNSTVGATVSIRNGRNASSLLPFLYSTEKTKRYHPSSRTLPFSSFPFKVITNGSTSRSAGALNSSTETASVSVPAIASSSTATDASSAVSSSRATISSLSAAVGSSSTASSASSISANDSASAPPLTATGASTAVSSELLSAAASSETAAGSSSISTTSPLFIVG